MGSLKISIVEDEMIIADSIAIMLQDLGYAVTEHAGRVSEALVMIEKERPDLLLIDIGLPGQLNGIDLAGLVKEKYGIACIFLTGNSDKDTIEKAKQAQPLAYLVKPVTKELLYSAIEIAFNNFNQARIHNASALQSGERRDFVFIKIGYQFQKLLFTDIVCIESEANYIAICLEKGTKILVRSTITEFQEGLDAAIFCRIHRRFTVNIQKIEKVLPGELVAGGLTLPLSKTYRDELFNILGI